MKKMLIVFGVAATLAAAAPLSAQRALGFRAGASLANLSLDVSGEEPDLSSRTGFHVGAYMDIPLSGNLFFQPGFGLTQKGAEISADEGTIGLHIDYLEIPLLFKYAFPTSGSLGVHVMGGPALAFELSCDISLEAEGFSADFACDEGDAEDVEIGTKSFDVGALLGGGVSFPMGGVRLTLEGFYNLGLANIVDDAADDETAKNRALYLTAGVAFPVGR